MKKLVFLFLFDTRKKVADVLTRPHAYYDCEIFNLTKPLAHFYSTCFIIPAGPDRRTVDPSILAEYNNKLQQYQKNKARKLVKN